MHMKRNEIEEQNKWDLSTIYKSVQDWEEAYQRAESSFRLFPELEKNMLKSADFLYQTVKQITETGEQVNRVYTYAHLKYSEDTSNPEAKKLMGQAQNLLTAFSEATAFFDTDLLSLKSEQLDTFLNESEDLREYEILLRDAFRYQPHTLSKAEEKLLASFQKERETASDVYEALTSADLKFGTIFDEEGEPAELTDTNYVVFLRSPDRLVRKLAFKTLYSAYQGHENTFAGLYAGQLEAEKVIAKVRNFDSALQMSLFADYVTPEIYNNIIESISGHLDVLFRYYRLKKKVLGLKEMHIYDIYLPMLPDSRKEYTYPEAVEEVLSAVEIFGKEYADILRKGYADRWVDVLPNEGKTGGAFSGGCATTNPFILLNFQNTEDDVSTLAHESGHSMHSYFTRNNNPLQYADYTIFVAEVPSTVNELVLAYYRLEHSQSREEKLSILNHLLELYKGTIYRQIMFAEFEKITHELSEQGEILTAELLCQKYYALNEKYFGGEVVLDKEIAMEWMRVPHFYYNFYVYKYAVGLTAASHIVKRIRNHEPGALEDYFAFLKLGTKKNPIDSLKVAGVDMTKTDAFDSAVEMFSQILDEFETIYDEK
ncbi:MAG: oligoendopeptidase F [Ruminococcus sp.]|nr:oligoendopeptidase F [Ruminococcus sp.]